MVECSYAVVIIITPPFKKHSGLVSSADFRKLTRQLKKTSCFIEIPFSKIYRKSHVDDDGDDELCRII